MPFFEVTDTGMALFKDKGSKFYGHAFPVKTEEDVKNCLQQLRKKYYDARHHCYAYRIGKNADISVAEDDGEPAHSAGDPILGQLRSRHLTNTLVVVVRYFGGTLLGVRGLIDAYKQATADALDTAPCSEIIPVFTFSLKFPYEKTSEINRLLHPFPIQILSSNYTESCEQLLQVHADYTPQIRSVFENGFGFIFEEIEF